MNKPLEDVLIEIVTTTSAARVASQRVVRIAALSLHYDVAANVGEVVVACTIADLCARRLLVGMLSSRSTWRAHTRQAVQTYITIVKALSVIVRAAQRWRLLVDLQVPWLACMKSLEWLGSLANMKQVVAFSDNEHAAWGVVEMCCDTGFNYFHNQTVR